MNKLNRTKQEIEADIIEKATQDPTFRQLLLAEPKRAISRFLGTSLPDSVHFTVIEETHGHHVLVLPPAPISVEALPLDELELALVGGGRTLRPGAAFGSIPGRNADQETVQTRRASHGSC